MNLHIPVDYERQPEFRMLVGALAGKRRNRQASAEMQAALSRDVEMASTFLWMRLWVELSYLAQQTNRPGWLTPAGAQLFEQSVDPLFGEGCEPLMLLEQAGVLEKRKAESGKAETGETEYYCDRFAKMNEHQAGNYKSREMRGATSSALERSKSRITEAADQQSLLLPTELFKQRDGTPLTGVDLRKAMVVIMTIDNCLKKQGRKKGEYSEGLIADAAEASKVNAETLRTFYIWLALHRDHPRVPQGTEQILADFGRMVEMSRMAVGPH